MRVRALPEARTASFWSAAGSVSAAPLSSGGIGLQPVAAGFQPGSAGWKPSPTGGSLPTGIPRAVSPLRSAIAVQDHRPRVVASFRVSLESAKTPRVQGALRWASGSPTKVAEHAARRPNPGSPSGASGSEDMAAEVVSETTASGRRRQLKVRCLTPAKAAALRTSTMRSWRVSGCGRMITGSSPPNWSMVLFSHSRKRVRPRSLAAP